VGQPYERLLKLQPGEVCGSYGMKKGVVFSLVLLILGGLAYFLYQQLANLDQIVEAGIEKYGSEMAKAPVTVDRVEIELSDGRAALKGLVIGNPSGFTSDYALSFDTIAVSLDLATITADPVVVKSVTIDKPSVIYELREGSSNIKTIQRNLDSYTDRSSEKDHGDGKEGKGPKIIIEDVYVTDGKVSVSSPLLNDKKIGTPLPDIHLEDIGKEEGGASPAEGGRQILAGITGGIGNAVSDLKLGGVMDKVGDTVSGAGQAIKEGAGAVGKKLKGLFD